jgi:hypothetical protein
MSAGMMLSSDDLEKVPSERLDVISMLLPPLLTSAEPVDLIARDMPEHCELVAGRAFDPLRLIALFNFDDDAGDRELRLPEGRWHAFELWDERYLGILEGSIPFPSLEPHGCRLVSLRDADGAPKVVGTAAHIGGGILDITDQTWDEASATLRVELSPVARTKRRIHLHAGGRRVRSADLDGAPLATAISGELVVCKVEVAGRATLTIVFDSPDFSPSGAR